METLLEQQHIGEVAYKREGGNSAFWLAREGIRVGRIQLKPLGDWSPIRYQVIVTPVSGITATDRLALDLWCELALMSASGSMFVLSDKIVEEPVTLH